MHGWVTILLIVVGWLLLMLVTLPRAGVPTWASSACRTAGTERKPEERPDAESR